MPIDLTSFKKALSSLESALVFYDQNQQKAQAKEREILRDGVIQRFEFTFELSWKMLKRYLEEYSLERVNHLTNREFFRLGFQSGMLRDVDRWLDFLHKRNLTSHTYHESTAQEVFESIPNFLEEAKFLLSQLEEKLS